MRKDCLTLNHQHAAVCRAELSALSGSRLLQPSRHDKRCRHNTGRFETVELHLVQKPLNHLIKSG